RRVCENGGARRPCAAAAEGLSPLDCLTGPECSRTRDAALRQSGANDEQNDQGFPSARAVRCSPPHRCDQMKGAQKQKKLGKKPPQRTLKERRADKRAAAKQGFDASTFARPK